MSIDELSRYLFLSALSRVSVVYLRVVRQEHPFILRLSYLSSFDVHVVLQHGPLQEIIAQILAHLLTKLVSVRLSVAIHEQIGACDDEAMVERVDARADEEILRRVVLRIILVRAARLRDQPRGQEAALASPGIAPLDLVDLHCAVAQPVLHHEFAALVLRIRRVHLRRVAQLLRKVHQLTKDVLPRRLRQK